jgi:type IV secretory pathway VirB10-like protein
VRRPDPQLRQRVALAVAEDRRAETRRRWLQSGALAVGLAAAALLLLLWWTSGRDPTHHELDASPLEQAAFEVADDASETAEAERTSAPEPAGTSGPAPEPEPPTTVADEPAPPPPPEPTPPPTPPVDDGTAEIRILRAAEVNLARNPKGTLTRLRAHERRFPASAFAVEREALFILALCELEDPAASARRDAFLRDHAPSAYAGRVRAACAP